MADQSLSSSSSGQTDKPGLGSVLREQAGKVADRSKDAGLETAEAVGKAAESAASTLQESSPALASYVRNAANYTHKLADDLRDRKAGDLLADAIAWGQKQPLMVLAGAAVLGFALSRVVKSGLATGDGGKASGDGAS